MPSEIARITNSYEAFCFDEAVSYIQSMMYYDYGKDGKGEGKLKWHKTPHWIDEDKPRNNSELFKKMQKQEQKYEKKG